MSYAQRIDRHFGIVAATGVMALATTVGEARLHASSIVTFDLAAAAAWQSGARILGFDATPGMEPYFPGTIVPRSGQLTAEYAACVGAVLSSAGGPAAIISVAGTTQQGDAQSQPNILGGTVLSGSNVVIQYVGFIEIEFVDEAGKPAPATRVGAWNDPSGSRIRLSVFDARGQVLETVEANQGAFLGIERPGIARARFQYVQSQGSQGFTLDDVTIGRGAAIGDLNGDGAVNAADRAILLGGWSG